MKNIIKVMAKNVHQTMNIAKIEESKISELRAPTICIGISIKVLSRVGL
jgi:hypothetical protein